MSLAARLLGVKGYLVAGGAALAVGLACGFAGAAKMDASALAKARGDAHAWHEASDAWRGAFGRSEANRATEQGRARDALRDAARACDKRLAEARSTWRAAHRVVNEPVKADAKGCPVRRVLAVTEPDMLKALGVKP